MQRTACINSIRSTSDPRQIKSFESIVRAEIRIMEDLRDVIDMVEQELIVNGIEHRALFRRLPECYHGDRYWRHYMRRPPNAMVPGRLDARSDGTLSDSEDSLSN
jgi:hypothetical protein